MRVDFFLRKMKKVIKTGVRVAYYLWYTHFTNEKQEVNFLSFIK